MTDEPDRWLPLRLDHEARVLAAEKRVERAARAALRAWLRSARTATLPVTAAALPPDPSALAGAGQAWFEAMTVHLLPAVDATFLAGVADAGGDVELLRVAQMKDEYLAALPNRLQGVPDSAWTQVTAAIAELTAEGASIPRIRDAIEAILGELSWEDRAVTIARTETIGAYNAGTLTAWLTAQAALDEKLDKVWVATHDERTRPDHRDADGQRVALDGVFMVGGVPMRYPGDPAAPPGQTVQCRCTMIEVEAGEPLPAVPEHPWPRRDRASGLDITVTAAGAAKGGKQMATWKGTLAPLGARSGDRRIFAADGQWSFRDLPLPLRWAREDAPGHEGAVTIGRITAGEVQKTELSGAGDFIDAVPELAEALELWRAGVLFPSVDLDEFEFVYANADGKPIEDMTDEEWEAFVEAGDEPYLLVTKGRVMAVTMLGTQAFVQARLELIDEVPTDDETPSDEVKEEEPVTAAGAAAMKKQVAPVYPPRGWFDDPGLEELTPITVTVDGRVFGHLADRDCHLSFLQGGQCVMPPEEGGFDWFHRPEIETAEGELVAVGHITAATGHADLAASAASAVAHYDDTGTQVAVVRAGRDAHGTWVAGSLVPEATEEQVQLLRRSPLSGDWRWIGGARQLVAALCVNVGGFPVVRGRTSGGRAYAMVASGWSGWQPSAPARGRRREPALTSPAALDAAVRRAVAAGFAAERQRVAAAATAERIAASIGRDRKALVAALAAQVHGE
ncbi:Phage Mu protein F like protein [Micromonospora echinofusca]|uniref:Phage Mu protein F like protein n=1 Tax=Micromonospora echinofusca TaxID=47858 RepID=A0A1C5G6X7_MICEH|nr:phage minor head protein [Micromonospora echinofusca]SCG15511.1 Phage Mu protein F like protein [Micromonospora echinofusca]